MEEYKFYMIRYGESDAVWKDLETDFPGLRYKECTGLNSYGEPTNMYAEDFAETSKAGGVCFQHTGTQADNYKTDIDILGG